jgi:hypothetical protein
MENFKSQDEDVRAKKLSEILKRNKKHYNYIAILSIIAILIGLTFIIISLINVKNRQTLTLNSLETKNQLIDSLQMQKLKRDSICKFTLDFLNAEKNDSNIHKYYASTLDVYYQRKNVPINYIIKNKRRFINSYPKSKFVFTKSNITVKLVDNYIAEVIANGLFYPDSIEQPTEIIYKLKIHLKENKIYSIENFTPNYAPKQNY